ncbi:MAG: hypothetical protein JWM12_3303 [Ilumatobacteraceae bacterium]|jgi:hypothetical protein|nr:hypothetical protein [Ilumatobacteraceae bacterium]
MADEAKPEKTLEMRVAELEDRLSQVHITEDEMKAYRKVAGLLGSAQTGTATPGGGTVAGGCVVDCVGCVNECGVIRQPILRQCVIRQPIWIRACTYECNECGPGQPGLGGVGGFTQFGG